MRKDKGFARIHAPSATACLLFICLAIILSGRFTVDSAADSTPVTIQGVVLTPQGAKFHPETDSKVEVKVCATGSKGQAAAGVLVAEDGSYTISQVIPDGDYLVYAEVQGSKNPYLDSKPSLIHLKEGGQYPIELTLTAPLVKGWVYKPDQTAFGSGYESRVEVYLTPLQSQDVLANGIVQADGSFKLGADLAKGNYVLHAEAQGSNNLYSDSAPLLVRLEPGKLLDANLFLTSPVIQGMVLKPNGTPYTKVSGAVARVWFQSLTNAEGGAEVLYQRISDNGSYKMGDLTPGEYLLGASIQGGEGTETDSLPMKIQIIPGQLVIQNITLTIPSITGRIFTPENKLFIPGPESGVEIALMAGGGDSGKEITRVSMRKDGSYGLGGNIPAGKYTLFAQTRGKENPYTNALPVDIQVAPGQPLVQDLRLTQPLIKGKVLTPGGVPYLDKPDSLVRVNLAKLDLKTNLLGAIATASLDNQGSFMFGGSIPAGEYQVTAETQGGANPYTASKPVQVHLNPGQIVVVELVLTNPILKGKVLKPEGLPISLGSGQEVTIRLEPFGMSNRQTDTFPVNPDGSYRVGNIPDGAYQVWAQVVGLENPYYDSEPVLVRLNGEKAVNQDLTLTQPVITGTIRTPDGNLFISGPDSGAEVILKSMGEVGREIIRVKAYSNGAYRLGGNIISGDYQLYGLASGAANPYLDAEPIRVHITPGLVIEQEIRFTRPVVQGQILTPKGSPFLPKEEATVEVVLKRDSSSATFGGASSEGADDASEGGADSPDAVQSWKAMVTETGAFKLGGEFSEGDYILEVFARGNNNPYADAEPSPLHLKSGDNFKLDICLTLPTVTGSLLDPNGLRLTTFLPGEVSLSIQYVNSKGDLSDYGRVPVNGNGSFNLRLPNGNYFISAIVETNRIPYTDSIPAPVEVTSGKTGKLGLRLMRPIISGRIFTPDDRPFISEKEKWVRIHLIAVSNGMELQVKEVSSDGTYKFGGTIPAGVYSLKTEAGGLKNKLTDAVPAFIQVVPGKAVNQNLVLTNPLVSGFVVTPYDEAFLPRKGTWSNVYLTTFNNPHPVAKKPVNSDGSFRLGGDIPAGFYLLHVEIGGVSCRYTDAIPVQVELAIGETVALNIRLTNPALRGKILLEGGEVFIPNPDSWVTVSLKTSETPKQEVASTRVNLDGTYQLGGGIGAGDYLIFVTTGGASNPYNDAAPVLVRLKADQLATKDLSLGSVNSPPVFTPAGNKSVNEGELLQFVVKALDPDGQPLSYSFTNLPLGASYISTFNSFHWIPYYFQAGTYKIQATVTDGKLTDRQTITITVNDVTPISLIRKLAKHIEALDLKTADKQALLDKLDLAIQSLGKKNVKTAIGHMNRLITRLQEMQNQEDSKLTPEKADEWIKIAQNIIYVSQL